MSRDMDKITRPKSDAKFAAAVSGGISVIWVTVQVLASIAADRSVQHLSRGPPRLQSLLQGNKGHPKLLLTIRLLQEVSVFHY
jgi:hypothetical protein